MRSRAGWLAGREARLAAPATCIHQGSALRSRQNCPVTNSGTSRASQAGVSAPSAAGRGPLKLDMEVEHQPGGWGQRQGEAGRISRASAGRGLGLCGQLRAGRQVSASGSRRRSAGSAGQRAPGQTALTAMPRGCSWAARMRVYMHSSSWAGWGGVGSGGLAGGRRDTILQAAHSAPKPASSRLPIPC